jgi:hypothetical protein
MRLALLLSVGMLVALLIGGGANMVRTDGCPELARELAPVSCQSRSMVTGNPVRLLLTQPARCCSWHRSSAREAAPAPEGAKVRDRPHRMQLAALAVTNRKTRRPRVKTRDRSMKLRARYSRREWVPARREPSVMTAEHPA